MSNVTDETLPIQYNTTQYLLSILMFEANNTNHYKFYSETHNINTRQNAELYQPYSRLSIIHKGILNVSI